MTDLERMNKAKEKLLNEWIKRDTPKKPNQPVFDSGTNSDFTCGYCYQILKSNYKFCPFCGQRINWRKEKEFEVIEDSGGGLYLAVFDENDQVEYLHDAYEYHLNEILPDIEQIFNGSDPLNDWEGNAEEPQKIYDDFRNYSTGWEIVANNEGLYPSLMGASALEAFGIDEEIKDYITWRDCFLKQKNKEEKQ